MKKGFKGKRALVTGGTRGIGRAVVELLEQQGAQVVFTGREQRKKEKNYEQVDFSDDKSLQAFLKKIEKSKPFDILVNNAGINKISPFQEIKISDYQKIMNVNLQAPLLVTQAVLPKMVSNKWGRIINISSIFGMVSKEYRASYSTSKFGLRGMTKALAVEVAEKGVLVNCVCPGFVNTELTESILDKKTKEKLLSTTPMKRFASVEEIAQLVVFLAGDNNTYITGQEIIIDGGFTCV